MTSTTDTSTDGRAGDNPVDERSLACAAGLIEAGRSRVEEVAVLTDEELAALDGISTAQTTAMPYLEEHTADEAARVPIARTAMRSLMARRLVISEIEAAEGEDRPLADDKLQSVTAEPRTTGALVLRRTSRILVWFEREVSTQIHRLYYYPHVDDVVLEEEVTADGVHMFTIMPMSKVPTRVRHLIDQPGVGGQDGPAATLAVADVESDTEMGPRLADTRALTVGSMVSRTTDVTKRVLFHLTSSEVIAGQPSPEGEEITLMQVSADSVEEIVADLFDDDGSAGESENDRTDEDEEAR
ncbi:hypothetical protein [Brachybacterium sp. ACRRE]|uniref:hypothetical protein n=1 Tax=Brachybacterium sp. ACRRE TaxID=2918184 RepID=UPI001EF17FDE|nr:hypothetical protein [Brachybacterium sp. ACRRE]MCG7308841.1 hypothetical protein [Brachybacterium sp. ACRRE]